MATGGNYHELLKWDLSTVRRVFQGMWLGLCLLESGQDLDGFFFCLGALKADRKLLYLMRESDPVCYVERLSR